MKHIVVIGGGVGGVSAASRLAARGFSVDLFEAGPRTGGKMNVVEFDGCLFDTGPTLLTMPFVLDDFFREMKSSLASELNLRAVDPACRYLWSDGTSMDIPFDVNQIPDAIATISEHDGVAFTSWINHAKEVYDLTKDTFIFAPFDGFGEFFKRRNLPLLPHIHRLRTLTSFHRHNSSYFRDRRILQFADRFATYNGSNPYEAPATLMVIPWVEFGFGAWYPQGGMARVAEAMTSAGQRHGLRVHTSTAVRKIVVTGQKVRGVELADGSFVAADHVISNVDVTTTRRDLLGESIRPPRTPSLAGFVVLASVDGTHDLPHHTVLFSDDYQKEFHQLFTQRTYADDPTIYISRSCVTDSALAPEGRENWFILVNAPALPTTSEPLTDPHFAERYGERIFARLRQAGLKVNIRSVHYRTAVDMEREWNSPYGSLYGAASNSPLSAFLRPRQQSTRLSNLWYVGGSAHPGGGIPLVTVSGGLAADLITSMELS